MGITATHETGIKGIFGECGQGEGMKGLVRRAGQVGGRQQHGLQLVWAVMRDSYREREPTVGRGGLRWRDMMLERKGRAGGREAAAWHALGLGRAQGRAYSWEGRLGVEGAAWLAAGVGSVRGWKGVTDLCHFLNPLSSQQEYS